MHIRATLASTNRTTVNDNNLSPKTNIPLIRSRVGIGNLLVLFKTKKSELTSGADGLARGWINACGGVSS